MKKKCLDSQLLYKKTWGKNSLSASKFHSYNKYTAVICKVELHIIFMHFQHQILLRVQNSITRLKNSSSILKSIVKHYPFYRYFNNIRKGIHSIIRKKSSILPTAKENEHKYNQQMVFSASDFFSYNKLQSLKSRMPFYISMNGQN